MADLIIDGRSPAAAIPGAKVEAELCDEDGARVTGRWVGTRSVTDGVLNSTTTVTSATAVFVAADVGMPIYGTGIPNGATVTARNSATSITISAGATVTATGVTLALGGFVADKVTGKLDSNGAKTLSLVPNASLTPANSHYLVTVHRPSDRVTVPFLITKGAGTETLVEAEDETPANLGILTPVDAAGATDGQALVFDDATDTWIPGSVATQAAVDAKVAKAGDTMTGALNVLEPSTKSNPLRLFDRGVIVRFEDATNGALPTLNGVAGTNASTAWPTEFWPVVWSDAENALIVTDPGGGGPGAGSYPAIGAAWWETGIAPPLRAYSVWSGVRPRESTPLLCVVPAQAGLGYGVWPTYGLGALPVGIMSGIGNPPDNFATYFLDGDDFEHQDNVRRWTRHDIDANGAYRWYVQRLDTGEWELHCEGTIPAAFRTSTLHGIALDCHNCTASYTAAVTAADGRINPVPSATGAAAYSPLIITSQVERVPSGAELESRVEGHARSRGAHTDSPDLFIASRVFT